MRAHRKARCFDPDQYALTITIAAARSVALLPQQLRQLHHVGRDPAAPHPS
jgi:acetolactate synthase regulatory subunit